MFIHKKNSKNRNTYKYYDAYGNLCSELRPGVDGVTEEDILRLHKSDDRIVYNNCRKCKAQIQNWEKELYKNWKDDYITNFTNKYGYMPNEENVQLALEAVASKNWNLSLDALIDDRDNSEGCGDKSEALLTAYESSQKADLPIVERLYEVVADMPENWQELFRLVLVEENYMVTVAKQRGVSEAAIRKIIKKIKKQIEEDEYLNKILR